jgi:hypothetical protein
MKGWRYEWIDALPQDVYEELIEMLQEEIQARELEQHD